MQSNDKLDVTEWVLTLDAGLRFIGRIVEEPAPDVLVLNPVFEYLTQIQFVRGEEPRREEALFALDTVGEVPLTVRPKAFFRVKDLPAWRQREIERLVTDGLKTAAAIATRKRSGIVIAGK